MMHATDFDFMDVIQRILSGDDWLQKSTIFSDPIQRREALASYTSALRGFDLQPKDIGGGAFKIVFTCFIRGNNHAGLDNHHLYKVLYNGGNDEIINNIIAARKRASKNFEAFTHYMMHVKDAFIVLKRLGYIDEDLLTKTIDAVNQLLGTIEDKGVIDTKLKPILQEYLNGLRTWFGLPWDGYEHKPSTTVAA